MVLEGTVHDLARKVLGGACRIHLEAEGPNLADRFERLAGIIKVSRQDRRVYVLEAERDMRDEVSRAAIENGGRLLALHPEAPGLDEVYTRYFKEAAHAA